LLKAKTIRNQDVYELTKAEMETLFKFRSERFCGPFSMFDNLSEYWEKADPEKLEAKIERFFDIYSKQRHKSVVGTPNVHCSVYSCDPKSKDVRPMFYGGFSHQFNKMKKIKEQVVMAKRSKMYIENNFTNERFKVGGEVLENRSDVDSNTDFGMLDCETETNVPFHYLS